MLTRTSSIRWLSAVVLLLILVMGSGAIGSAQEEGSGTPSSTPAGDVGSRISIGDESVSGIGTEEAELPDATSTVTQDSAQSPENGATATETPIPGSGIGTNDDSGVSTGDGSPVPGGTPAETETPAPAETPDEPVQATSVGVSVTIYLCTADYAGGDPAADSNCSPASGVDVAATADGADLGTQTTGGSGTVSVEAPDGSQVVFTEVQSTLPSGYVPDGNGTAHITATAGASATIANIQVQMAGRLQISNGQCPTSGDARTQFIVLGPLAVQATGLGCAPLGGTTLTVTGPGGTYSALTDSAGNWIGTVPVGVYTISNANGSEELEVQAGATTIVLVVDYVPGPKGSLTIQRFDCAEGAEGTTITIDGGPNNDSCLPSNERVSVSAAGGNAAPLVIDLGDDGTTSVDVAAGAYVVTDGPTGVSANVDVVEGGAVTATINSTILTGVVSASLYWCDSSVSGSVNPTTWGKWANKCGQAGAGIQVSLLDGNGSVVSSASTGSGGSLSFSSVMPGRYSLSASNGCALFANGADARNGFDIVAGAVVEIAAFGCAEPASIPDGPSDPAPGPGTIGGSDGSGSDGSDAIGSDDSGFGGAPLADPQYHSRSLMMNPLSNVSTLPATGEGIDGPSGQTMLLLLGMAALSAGLAFGLSSDRRKRTS